jgi:hypothetical protein
MMKHAMRTQFALGASFLLISAGAAMAFPVKGTYVDGPDCDNHGPQVFQDELGEQPLFPLDELIQADATLFPDPVCPPTDLGLPNALIIMTNLSGRDWTDLFYVADPDTNITNVDGFATSAADPAAIPTQAFRIDMLGVHRSLIAESIANDGVFQAGETWEFVLQDFTNSAGLGPADFGSLDFAGASAFSGLSSGSIVSLIPAPGAGAVAALGGFVAIRRRRSA